jgi:uncharacterized protein (DUF433 family)
MARQQPDYLERISQDPAVMVGKPVVLGTRIPVELVLARLSHDLDLDELFAAYPHLTIEDVKACLAYAEAAVRAKRRRTGARSAARVAAARV